MSPNPESFLDHLTLYGYHSRSDKHSNALAEAIVADLIKHCPAIQKKAALGDLVYDLNFTIMAGTSEWNVDLVLGSPAFGTAPPEAGAAIRRASPSSVEVAIEIKSVMTEHRKAIKNRKRDLEAHHEHVHNYNQKAVAGGVLVVNGAERFKSPLRSVTTAHRNVKKLVEHCVNEIRAVATRGGSTGYGLEAKCVIAVAMENEKIANPKYMIEAPVPQVGDPLHYDAFIQALCARFTERF